MSLPANMTTDSALEHFLRAHGVLRRLSAGKPFVATLGAPAMARVAAGKVIYLGGYYQLAIRGDGEHRLEIGFVCSRRPDMGDWSFIADSARPLCTAADLRSACATLAHLTAA